MEISDSPIATAKTKRKKKIEIENVYEGLFPVKKGNREELIKSTIEYRKLILSHNIYMPK